MAPESPFTSIRALSFDIYGTLMDWESGLLESLEGLRAQLPATHIARVSAAAAVAAFMRQEMPLIRADPKILYDDALRQAYLGLAREWGLEATDSDADALVAHVPRWKAFPDTVAAMQRLSKHFKLVALSNVSRRLFEQTMAGPLHGVPWAAAYLAQDIGAYKPADKNFDYLLEHVKADFGVERTQLFHVGHGVPQDMVPAERYGLQHAWIERGDNNWMDTLPTKGLRVYKTLGDLADDVERELGKK